MISSSYRPKGNGEALLNLCRKTLTKFDLTQIYLKDFNIKNCTGCMSCVINKDFCKINDDLKDLIEQILSYDALLISSPVYFLGAASIIKTINDRLLSIHNFVDYKKRKPAGIIITAGRTGWEGFSIQNLSVLLLSLGFYIKDVIVTHAQGPSEVLLNTDITEKMALFTENIINPDYKIPNISNKCPVCFGESFNILGKSRIKCPVCNISGEIIDNGDKPLILFSENDINSNRWSDKNLKDHMENWVAKSWLEYRKKVREVMQARKKLLN